MSINRIVVGVALIVGLCAGETFALSYTITNLGGQDSVASGINNAGQVVGSFTYAGSQAAFLYSRGVMTNLGNLGGTASHATGINASGQVVGGSRTASNELVAFLYSGGIMTNLGTLPGDSSSVASGINDAGQIVGHSSPGDDGSDAWTSFLYSDGAMTALMGIGYNYATGINASGQVVGNNPGPGPYIYSDGVVTHLNYQGGAYGINDAGQIVGRKSSGNAIIYSNGSSTYIGSLGGTITVPYNISNSGQVVGFSYTGVGSDSMAAFLYSGDVMTNLNDLIPNDSGWLLHVATDINDVGQIVGQGWLNGQVKAFLLTPDAATPVPEPSTMLLLGGGLAGLAFWRKRKSVK